MEESILNFVSLLSLEEHRKDPTSKFNQLSIPVKTMFNNGVIKTPNGYITNGCCFKSIAHGMRSNGIRRVLNKYPVSSLNLIRIANYKDINIILDTDNDIHLKCLEMLVKKIPELQLHFFFGMFVGNQWMTGPDPSIIIGKGPCVIRILNKPGHFEYITNDAKEFVRPPRTMTLEKLILDQIEQEIRIKGL